MSQTGTFTDDPIPMYEDLAGVRVPPQIVTILFENGGFLGTENPLPVEFVEGGGDPVYSVVTVIADTAVELLAADPNRRGARVLNYLPEALYISGDTDPVEGPPSDFCPPASLDTDDVIWPSQFVFDFPPREAVYVKCATDGDITLITW